MRYAEVSDTRHINTHIARRNRRCNATPILQTAGTAVPAPLLSPAAGFLCCPQLTDVPDASLIRKYNYQGCVFLKIRLRGTLKKASFLTRLRSPASGGAARRLAPLRGAIRAAARRLWCRRCAAAFFWKNMKNYDLLIEQLDVFDGQKPLNLRSCRLQTRFRNFVKMSTNRYQKELPNARVLVKTPTLGTQGSIDSAILVDF